MEVRRKSPAAWWEALSRLGEIDYLARRQFPERASDLTLAVLDHVAPLLGKAGSARVKLNLEETVGGVYRRRFSKPGARLMKNPSLIDESSDTVAVPAGLFDLDEKDRVAIMLAWSGANTRDISAFIDEPEARVARRMILADCRCRKQIWRGQVQDFLMSKRLRVSRTRLLN